MSLRDSIQRQALTRVLDDEDAEKLQALLEDPANAEVVRNFAAIRAEHEHSLRETALALADAVDADHDVPAPTPVDERVDELAALVAGLRNHDIREAWLEHWGPDLPEDANDPSPYMGLDADEWTSKRQQWAERYRQEGGDGLAQLSDRRLADAHVRSQFGVSLAEFEREIVEWSRGDALREAVSGPHLRTEDALDAALDATGGSTDG